MENHFRFSAIGIVIYREPISRFLRNIIIAPDNNRIVSIPSP